MALCFRKKRTYKTGFYFLISYFCIIIILANVNFSFNYLSEIKITVEGTGRQQILSDYSGQCGSISGRFNSLPNETLVNGVPQSSNDWYVDNLVIQTNIITLRWNYQVTNCSKMFYRLKNIISIDLSNFDTSKVEIFDCMLHSCTSLKSINLNNVNTSSAKNMDAMFQGCSGLEKLNLSSFDTSKVTTMLHMFYSCTSLKSLDLSNFETPELEETRYMFQFCSSLVLLNIINFNILSISASSSDKMFSSVNRNLIYCADESKISSNIKSLLNNYVKNCTHSCLI